MGKRSVATVRGDQLNGVASDARCVGDSQPCQMAFVRIIDRWRPAECCRVVGFGYASCEVSARSFRQPRPARDLADQVQFDFHGGRCMGMDADLGDSRPQRCDAVVGLGGEHRSRVEQTRIAGMRHVHCRGGEPVDHPIRQTRRFPWTVEPGFSQVSSRSQTSDGTRGRPCGRPKRGALHGAFRSGRSRLPPRQRSRETGDPDRSSWAPVYRGLAADTRRWGTAGALRVNRSHGG